MGQAALAGKCGVLSSFISNTNQQRGNKKSGGLKGARNSILRRRFLLPSAFNRCATIRPRCPSEYN
jgi:hypothetical protein